MSTAVPATRILDAKLERKIMSAETAASLIQSGDQIGMSGFTGSGYPNEVPLQLAKRIADAHFRGEKFQVSVFTGASTGPELDGALAMAGGIQFGCRISRTRRRASGSTRARWTTWISTSAM